MILLSSHADKVKQESILKFDNGEHSGLLDNFIGVLTTYLALYDDSNLLKLEKSGKIKIFHSQGEEWGILSDYPKQVSKNDIVVCIDVCSGNQYKGLDFSIENVNGIDQKVLKDLKENLEWEGFKFSLKKYTGDVDDEDESWSWITLGIPVMSFIIPIQGISWHKEDCFISSEKVLSARQGLKRLITYLL